MMISIYSLEEIKNNKIDLDFNSLQNILINANALDALDIIPVNSIDLVVTSPPYDNLRDYKNEIVWNLEIFQTIANKLYRVLKKGGTIVWVVGDKTDNKNKSLTSFRQALYFQEIGFKLYDVLIYEKSGTGPPHPNRYFNAFEYMFIISKGNIKTVNLLKDKPNKWGGKSTFSNISRREKDGTLTDKGKKIINKYGIRTNIWKYVNGKNFSTRDGIAYKHPAIFPEKLVKDHILSWSNKGDVVLDPFGGSGTTAKVARELNRKWIYIEKVKEYCQIAKERLNNS
jgi:DNA modification methylase